MLKESLLPSFEHATPENLIIVGLIFYIIYLVPKLANFVKLFENDLVKAICLFLIVYSVNHSVAISIIGSIALIVTLDMLKNISVSKEHMSPVSNISNDFKRSGMTMDMIPDHSLDMINDINDVKETTSKCSTNFYPQYDEEQTKITEDDISVNGFDGGANYSNI